MKNNAGRMAARGVGAAAGMYAHHKSGQVGGDFGIPVSAIAGAELGDAIYSKMTGRKWRDVY